MAPSDNGWRGPGGYAPRPLKTRCARGACPALLGGPAISPFGVGRRYAVYPEHLQG